MQKTWWIKLAGVVGGVLVAGLCIALLETMTHRLLSGEPVFAGAVGAMFLGALVGGTLAVRLAGAASYGWLVAAALALLSAINVMSFAHPAWFVPAAICALAMGGWLATRAVSRRGMGS